MKKTTHYQGGIYHKTKLNLTYHSNHIEGNRLSFCQVKSILDTNTMIIYNDDIIEIINHFRCIDVIIDHAKVELTEKFIKELHYNLKHNTSETNVGDYKLLINEVGNITTTKPEKVHHYMKILLNKYNAKKEITFDDILDFHVQFERIHPFQDGNGRIGRLIMFKECIKNNIVPFIIEDDLKCYYYHGLSEWNNEKGYLRDTCLTAQDKYKAYLDCFGIDYAL